MYIACYIDYRYFCQRILFDWYQIWFRTYCWRVLISLYPSSVSWYLCSMNVPSVLWMSHVLYECSMCSMNVPCVLWMFPMSPVQPWSACPSPASTEAHVAGTLSSTSVPVQRATRETTAKLVSTRVIYCCCYPSLLSLWSCGLLLLSFVAVVLYC